ncbi:hypothetical protein F2Q69_00026998 [Brassica cretica]|uniref:Uncharacterized protein n=1 Tax=Brassica cretica TaxID=69181 RepID=A0A8S9RV77_BRACR|nr:hypothetical protein F2Q69_00026998 [Brassica cretica]
MAATKMVFHHMVLIFHLFKDLDLICRFFRSGSLLIESSPMSPFHNRSERFGFLDLGLIYMFFRSGSDFGRPVRSLLKYNALEDFQKIFQTTSKKSSRRLPGSLLTGFSSISSGV